jgi:hypothetical protein
VNSLICLTGCFVCLLLVLIGWVTDKSDLSNFAAVSATVWAAAGLVITEIKENRP